MKIIRILSKRSDYCGRAQVLLRLTVDHHRQYRLKSGIIVNRTLWEAPSARASAAMRADHARALTALSKLEEHIYELCANTPREQLSASYLRRHLGLGYSCDAGITAPMDSFLAQRRLSVSRMRQYRTLERMLGRYAAATGRQLVGAGCDSARVADFMRFLDTEHLRDPSQPRRGHNTLCSVGVRLRTYLRWAGTQGICASDAGESYAGPRTEVYGTPFFLDASEVELLTHANLSDAPALAVQRDVFVFQCLTGCRVSDLTRLRAANIVNGALEYVAAKTRRDHATLVRVPLHPAAAAIVRRYASGPAVPLLPCVSPTAYNRAIRAVLSRCGITRAVSVLDPVSGLERQLPLNEIAGSHLARRTFVGNLYRIARDPCLVGAMSGHRDGSKAFARYRHIDDTLKRELILQTFCRHTPPSHTLNI